MSRLHTWGWGSAVCVARRIGAAGLIALCTVFSFARAAWEPSGIAGQDRLAVPGAPRVLTSVSAPVPLLLVGSSEPAQLRVVDAATGSIRAALALPGAPISVSTNAAATQAYIACADVPQIIRVDLASNTITGRWALAVVPAAIALIKNGADVVAADRSGKRLIVLNANTGASIGAFALDARPVSLAANPTGEILLVGTDAGSVHALNTVDWKLRSSGGIGAEAGAIVWWNSGALALVLPRRGDAMHFMNVDTGAVQRIDIQGDPVQESVDQSLNQAYIASDEDLSINVVNLVTKTIQGRYATPDAPAAIAYDPVKRSLYVAQPLADQVLRLNLAQAQIAPGSQVKLRFRDIAIDDSQGEVVAVTDKGGGVLARTNLGTRLRRVLPLGFQARTLALDPTLKLAVVSALNPYDLRFVDLSAGTGKVLPAKVELAAPVAGLAGDPNRNLTLAVLEGIKGAVIVDNKTKTILVTVSNSNQYTHVGVDSDKGIAYLLRSDRLKLDRLDLTTRAFLPPITLPAAADSFSIATAQNAAVLLDLKANKGYVLNLATGVASAPISLPARPRSGGVQSDTATALVHSRESDNLSTIDVPSASAVLGIANIAKPLSVAVSTRYNLAVAISAELDALQFVQLSNPAPVLDALDPPDGLASPSKLKLNGKHFLESSRVVFNGTEHKPTWLSSGLLEVTLPTPTQPLAELVPVLVKTPAPGGGSSTTLQFRTRKSSAPTLTSISPSTFSADALEHAVTLTGTNFVSGASAEVATQKVPTTFANSTTLRATIPASLTGAAGTLSIRVVNPDGSSSNALSITLTARGPRIDSLTPNQGPTGATVTITGAGFAATAAGNVLTFAGPAAATVLSASSTQLTVRVPTNAKTGPITLATAAGTATGPVFTVATAVVEDFKLQAQPATATLLRGSSVSIVTKALPAGTLISKRPIELSVSGLPAGVSASFTPTSVVVGQSSTLELVSAANAAAASANVSIQGTAAIGSGLTRAVALQLTVSAPTNSTGATGRFVNPRGEGIAGVKITVDSSNVQAISDAAGNFRLVGLPVGNVTLRLDGTPANPAYPMWPYNFDTRQNQLINFPDWVIADPPTADKFTPITPAAANEQIVRDQRFPGLEIKIPAGVSIIGWDGAPKTKIAVERLDPDKLPVGPPQKPGNPAINESHQLPTRSVYQMFFGTPMGGMPTQPIEVTAPNDTGFDPGEKTELWYFDGAPGQVTGTWKQAGTGTVSADGKTVKTDTGSGIPRFCGVCGLWCFIARDSVPNPPCNDCGRDIHSKCATCKEDPRTQGAGGRVTLATGQELLHETDLVVDGITPIVIGRVHNPFNFFQRTSGRTLSMGNDWMFTYDYVLVAVGNAMRLTMPGYTRVDFQLETNGRSYARRSLTHKGAYLQQVGPDWQLRFRDGTVWKFAQAQFPLQFMLVEQRDSNGNWLRVQRNGGGFPVRIETSGGRWVQINYGTNGLMSTVTDAIGRTVQYGYATSLGNNTINAVTAPDGKQTIYTYVEDSETILPGRISVGSGGSVPMTVPAPFSGGNRIKTILRPGDTNPTQLFYGPGRRVLLEILPDQTEVRFSYQLVGATVIHKCELAFNPVPGCAPPNRPDIDSWDNLLDWHIRGGTIVATTVTYANGKKYSVRFNADGIATELTDEAGQLTKFEHNNRNLITKITDPLLRVTQYEYDDSGNRTKIIDPVGRETVMTYTTDTSRLTSVTRRLNSSKSITYTVDVEPETGNVLSITDPLGHKTRFKHARGQVTAVIDALTHSTSFGHNAAGDREAVSDHLGNAIHFGYDSVGRRRTMTDALGYTTTWDFNVMDQVIQIVDANGGLTKFGYDPSRRELESVTNPRGFVIESYVSDAMHRLRQRRDAKNAVETYDYDSVGNLKQIKDRKNQTTDIRYDDLRRPTEIRYADGNVEKRTYDKASRMIRIEDDVGVIEFDYDNLDRLKKESTNFGGFANSVEYDYDNLDRRIRRTLNGADPTDYEYDDASRLKTIRFRGDTVIYTWDDANRLQSRILPNAIAQDMTYDNANRLERIKYTRTDGSVVEDIQYTYDPNGRRISRSMGMPSLGETPMQATYDAANRMTAVSFPDASQSFAVTYDANGNVAARTSLGTNISYAWNTKDQLTRITVPNPSSSASYRYDAIGRRIERLVTGERTQYVFDGIEVLRQEDAGGRRDTLTGPSIDDVIASYSLTKEGTYIKDALGSVVGVVEPSQSIRGQRTYTPYGESAPIAAGSGDDREFTARENDQIGLLFYRARYYDSLLKRFISEDPIWTFAELNQYAYASGDPSNRTDPLGLFSIWRLIWNLIDPKPSKWDLVNPIPIPGIVPGIFDATSCGNSDTCRLKVSSSHACIYDCPNGERYVFKSPSETCASWLLDASPAGHLGDSDWNRYIRIKLYGVP